MGKAQLHKELLANGGFEQYAKSDTPPSTGDEDGDEDGDDEEEDTFDRYQKPLFWYISDQLGYSRIKEDVHGGQFAVKLYPSPLIAFTTPFIPASLATTEPYITGFNVI